MPKEKKDNVSKMPAPALAVVALTSGTAGQFHFEKLGSPEHESNGRGFAVDVTLRVEIGDEQTTGAQLPMEYNHYRALLLQAAAGGLRDTRTRTLNADGILELHDFIDGKPELVFTEPLVATVKRDTFVAVAKRSRYDVVVRVHCKDSAQLARLADCLDCDVRVQFSKARQAEGLPPEAGDDELNEADREAAK